jgi:hypothetical protein
VDVAKPERIVFDHVSKPAFLMTITLAEAGPRKTTITWRGTFPDGRRVREGPLVRPAANEQNLDRLEAELARMGDQG